MEGDADAERDCTLLVRALVQGPDPLYLMEVCPAPFRRLCARFCLSEAEGRDAIERAHWMGPGIFFADGSTGFRVGVDQADPSEPLLRRQERFWLLLASASDCTEGGYTEDTTFKTILQKQAAAVAFLHLYHFGVARPEQALHEAYVTWVGQHVPTDYQGLPLYDDDIGFYLAYKAGHKIAACRAGDCIFIGTTPDTTLVEQGYSVDKEISPSFGIRYTDPVP